jgi:hypothetical protein
MVEIVRASVCVRGGSSGMTHNFFIFIHKGIIYINKKHTLVEKGALVAVGNCH